MIQLGPYNYEPTITAKWSYRTTVHVWRVRCGTYRGTSTNECDHNSRCTYFIIARSFARPPSLLLLLWSMIILCFEVVNTVPGTCLMRILVYVIHIVVRVRMRVKKGIKTTNACIQLPTTQKTYTLYEYTYLMFCVSRPKNERFIDGQSRGSWGAFFTWFWSVPVFEKKVTGYTRFWLLPI